MAGLPHHLRPVALAARSLLVWLHDGLGGYGIGTDSLRHRNPNRAVRSTRNHALLRGAAGGQPLMKAAGKHKGDPQRLQRRCSSLQEAQRQSAGGLAHAA
jgi:hypothetical protein